jgi:hypothetical protein
VRARECRVHRRRQPVGPTARQGEREQEADEAANGWHPGIIPALDNYGLPKDSA